MTLARPAWLTAPFLFFVAFALGASATPVDATFTAIHIFSGADGGTPMGPLISDAGGNLYGVAEYGGAGKVGVVFELSPPPQKGGQWTETVLHQFAKGPTGWGPQPGMAVDRSGDLFGVTFDGGNCTYGCGVAFELSPPARAGGRWRYTVLHNFHGAGIGDGGGPVGNIVIDPAGNLYGETVYGGYVTCTSQPGPCGTVFRLAPPSSTSGSWTETVLHSFAGVPDGDSPESGVTLDTSGNVYGATGQGGTGRCTDGEGLRVGCGTVFELSPRTGSWNEQIIHDFGTKVNGPQTQLLLGPSGAFLGADGYDLTALVPQKAPGRGWNLHVLFQFTEGIAGTLPVSALLPDGKGDYLGTSAASGLYGFGTIYRLSPPATRGRPWAVTALRTFKGGIDSNQPRGGLILGADGALYGTVSSFARPNGGYVFRLGP